MRTFKEKACFGLRETKKNQEKIQMRTTKINSLYVNTAAKKRSKTNLGVSPSFAFSSDGYSYPRGTMEMKQTNLGGC